MLLEVVALAGDVGRDLDAAGEAHAGDLAQRGVRLLGGVWCTRGCTRRAAGARPSAPASCPCGVFDWRPLRTSCWMVGTTEPFGDSSWHGARSVRADRCAGDGGARETMPRKAGTPAVRGSAETHQRTGSLAATERPAGGLLDRPVMSVGDAICRADRSMPRRVAATSLADRCQPLGQPTRPVVARSSTPSAGSPGPRVSIVAVARHAGPGRDQLADDDVLLEAEQRVAAWTRWRPR